MKDVAIEFNHVGKQYRLGVISTGTLSQDLNRWWAKIRGKEDPFLKVGEENDRSKKATSQFVWALKDIDFKVYQGDVLGIIGKNGAGKSTLLKVLSRVTSPTTGSIRAKGRIASLLEVGTGFHPEMTGRENIYMNGSIMGMTKEEITRKLDEIVDFAGIAKFIDTPVKRYSSGMTVRLGFSIAAHLEPEILVVDEVLAVGDAEFQKKAVGKMQDVSKGEGRTVLFVSHNMAAVKSLCTKGLVLQNGQSVYSGEIQDCINFYLNEDKSDEISLIKDRVKWTKPGLKITDIRITGTDKTYSVIQSHQTTLEVELSGHTDTPIKTDLMIIFKSKDNVPMMTLAAGHYKGIITDIPAGDFTIKKTIHLPKIMTRGILYADVMMHHPMVEWQLKAPDCCTLDTEGYQEDFGFAINQNDGGIMGLEYE